jgi:DNA replication protein DnaC
MTEPVSLRDALLPVKQSMMKRISSEAETPTKEPTGRSRKESSRQTRECPVCQGAGFCRTDVPYGHPDFGKLVECTACDTLVKRRLSALEIFSSLRGDLLKCDFSQFEQVEGAKPSRDAAVAFAQNPRGWLVLHGPNGSGKTHLAAALALNLRAKGKAVLFMRVPDLMEFLRHAYDEQSLYVQSVGASGSMTLLDRLENVRRAPVLVLDDLAAESDSPWVREKLYQILDYRMVEQLPTVITLNIVPEEWEGALGARISDRLQNRLVVKIVQNRAPSFRKAAPSGKHRREADDVVR